jgi:hypothetical protein
VFEIKRGRWLKSRKKYFYWNPKNYYFKEHKIFKQILVKTGIFEYAAGKKSFFKRSKYEASNKHNNVQKTAFGKCVSSTGIAINQN